MAEVPSWQKQNMAKNGGASAPSQMNPKLMPSGASAGLHKKIAAPSFGMGGLVSGGKKVAKFADGSEGGVSASPQFDMGEFAGVDKAVSDMASGPDALAKENYDGSTQEKVATNDEVRAAADEGAAKPQSFKEAFAENRKAGNKTFEYNGKSFTTDIATARANRTDAEKKQEARSVVAKSLTSKPVRGADFDPDSIDNFSGSKPAPKAATAQPSTAARVVQPRGRGVIDTSNIDPVTLLPRR